MIEVFENLLKYNYHIDYSVDNGKIIINDAIHIVTQPLLNFSFNEQIPINIDLVDACARRGYRMLVFYNEKLASIDADDLKDMRDLQSGEGVYWIPNVDLDLFEVSNLFSLQQKIDFVQLHLHSEYSVLDGIIGPEVLVDFAVKHSVPAVCITDHGSMGAHLPLSLSAKSKGIKPLFGIETYMVDGNAREKDKKETRYHITLIAKNETGYKNLLNLNRYGVDNFYYTPRIDISSLWNNKEGIICLSACMGGYIPRVVADNDHIISKEVKNKILQFKAIFEDDLYFELMPLGFDGAYDAINYALISFARNNGIRCVATNDVHYLYADQQTMHTKFIRVSDGFDFDNGDIWYKDRQQMIESFESNCPGSYGKFNNEIINAIDTVDHIVDECSFDFDLGEFRIPEYNCHSHHYYENMNWKQIDYDDLPLEFVSKKSLFFFLYAEEKLNDYADKINMSDKEWDLYYDRLIYELDTIDKLNVVDYFLIVDDLFRFCSNNDIFAHCRGSVGGSLVAFLLDFVKFDPVEHKISFDRFVSPARIESGENDIDIDIDIENKRRSEVFEYLSKKYGKKNTARVGAYQRLQIKQAIKSIASVELKDIESRLKDAKENENTDKKELDLLSKLKEVFSFVTVNKVTSDIYIQQSDFIDNVFQLGLNDFGKEWLTNNNYSVYKWYLKHVKPVIGVIKSKSIHAAGLVITPGNVNDFLSVMRTKDGDIVTEAENSHTGGEFLNAFGILTLDILGVKTLSIFKDSFAMIKERHGKDLNIEDIDINDEEMLAEFGKGNTPGIFQFSGRNVTSFLRNIKPDRFNDIVAVNSLNRPGPLSVKAHELYEKRKHGKDAVDYMHKSIESILGDTYGVPIYSEHMMGLVTNFAGLDAVDAEKLRKLQKAKKPDEFIKFKTKFIDGAIKKWSDENEERIRYIANEAWRLIEHHGKYNFPKAHSTAYGLYAVISMHLKKYYSHEFFTAWLNYIDADEKLEIAVVEAVRYGITFKYPDINTSKQKFVLDGNEIIMPLTMLKHVGPAIYDSLKKIIPVNNFDEFCDRAMTKGSKINKKAAVNMILIGCFDKITSLSVSQQLERYFEMRKDQIPDEYKDLNDFDLYLIKPDILGIDVIDYGDIFSSLWKNYIDKVDDYIKIEKVAIGTDINLVGKVTKVKEHSSKKGKMAFIDLKVAGLVVNVVAFNDFWGLLEGKKGAKPKVNDIILITGTKHIKRGVVSLHTEPTSKLKILLRR